MLASPLHERCSSLDDRDQGLRDSLKDRIMRFAAVLLSLSVLTAAPVAAQQTQDGTPLSIIDAVRIGRQQAVNAVSASRTAEAAAARVGQRRADLLPTING